jgi:hypothetical protein
LPGEKGKTNKKNKMIYHSKIINADGQVFSEFAGSALETARWLLLMINQLGDIRYAWLARMSRSDKKKEFCDYHRKNFPADLVSAASARYGAIAIDHPEGVRYIPIRTQKMALRTMLAAEDWGEYIVQVREEGGRERKMKV